jgi:Tfp pilus assembly protein PilN
MLTSGFNLATSDYRRSRRRSLLAGGLAVLIGFLLIGQLLVWNQLRREVRSVDGRLQSMEREFHRRQARQQDLRRGIPEEALKRYRIQVAAYNRLLEAAAFSWTGLLVELERAVPPAVVLTQIQPDPATGQVALQGTAPTFDDVGRLLKALERRPAFRDVYLLRQAWRKPVAGGADMLDFSVRLAYQGEPR